MPLTFSSRDELELEAAAWRHFDCQPTIAGDGTRKTRKEQARRERKRRDVSRASDAFFKAMNSGSPPRTEDEAVAFVLPMIGSWLLAWLFRSVAEAVIRWLWKKSMTAM